jgi:hypothetical protein
MDEAQTLAPFGAMTACTQSTLALGSRARRYGLGLVFATEAPKGLHNRIPGNAATSSSACSKAPPRSTRRRRWRVPRAAPSSDVARLRAGQFYATIEGGDFVKPRPRSA